jgi:hypothetical protein
MSMVGEIAAVIGSVAALIRAVTKVVALRRGKERS